MLSLLLSLALGGGAVALQAESVVLRDRVMSTRAYSGGGVGPRLGLELGSTWRWRSHLSGVVGGLGPVGLGRRVFTGSDVDVLTGEEFVGTLKAPLFALHAQASTGLERVYDAVSIGADVVWDANYASGFSLQTWALSSVQLRPRIAMEWQVSGWRIQGSVDADVLGLVTRLPWSANPLRPGQGLTSSFFASGTRVSGPWDHLASTASVRVRQENGGWTGWLAVAAVHDWEPAPLTQVRATLAIGWSK